MKTCESCLKEFEPTRNSRGRFCSRSCAGNGAKIARGEAECRLCGSNFVPKVSAQVFCSRSCSASFNNAKSPKRKRQGICGKCELPRARSGRKFCSDCWQQIRAERGAAELGTRKSYARSTYDCECGAKITKRGTLCIECHTRARSGGTIEEWLEGKWNGSNSWGLMSKLIRTHLLKEADGRCQSPTCDVPGGFSTIHPVTGRVPLEIDHIDGDSSNHSPSNLIVICPNCHALTPTYRALNKNSKRSWRRALSASA